ncbi:putative membrane protein [Shimwellia blattae DSM 4481 = NBRC 105725]|uniref:Putative membrane protein n=1 Tax=Shimwellia blattae (strain ATCC 29907 / DSM 4481 / JCM 1650 / NBRC 105725 / CDC 9005-74) TaxID=630626 RepID=I2B8N7_SHIBC|nr:putative membrane protein [Shimwellia blattae DSM 4481 = NBRC 105725]
MAFFSHLLGRNLLCLDNWRIIAMQLILIFIVIAGGMGLSVEAGLLGPLGGQVGDLWATFSVFGVGAGLTFLLMLFFSPRNSPSFFAQPSWQLLGVCLGRFTSSS